MRYKLRFERQIDRSEGEWSEQFLIFDMYNEWTGCSVTFFEDGSCEVFDPDTNPEPPSQAILDWFDGLTPQELNQLRQNSTNA
jgi:hypothetical protein